MKNLLRALTVLALLAIPLSSYASLGSKDLEPSLKKLESRNDQQSNSNVSKDDQKIGDKYQPTEKVDEDTSDSDNPIKELADKIREEELKAKFGELSPAQQKLVAKAYELEAQHAKFLHCSDAVNQLYKQALGTRVWDTPRISTSSSLQAGDHVIFYNGNKYSETGEHSVMILDTVGPNRYLVWEQGNKSQGARISTRTIATNLISHINRFGG